MKNLINLRRDRRSMVAIIFAILAIPLIGVIGLAIDYGALSLQRVRLNAAADSAALAAVNAAANAYSSNPLSNYIAFGQQAGSQTFTAQAGSLIFGSVPTPTVSVTRTNGTFTATVSYSASVTASLAQVLGTRSFSIAGNSGSTVTPQRYVAIQMFLDISPSMGLLTDTVNGPAALLTAANNFIGTHMTATNMFDATSAYNGTISVANYTATSNTQNTCEFACHNDNTTTGPSGKSNDYYGVAQANGIQMRIDVLRSGVQNVIQQMQSNPNSQYLQVGIYTFATNLSTLYATSTNLSGAYTAAQGLQVMALTPYCFYGTTTPVCAETTWPSGSPGLYQNGWWGFRDGAVASTNFETSANSYITATLTPAPVLTGVSAATAARYMFLVTDGMDDYTPYTGRDINCCNPQYVYPMNTTNGVNGTALVAGSTPCDTIKAAGVTIMVLYTTYQSTGLGSATSMVSSYLSPSDTNNNVVTALQGCASPGNNFFQAATAAQIGTQLNNMYQIATASAGRFTQ